MNAQRITTIGEKNLSEREKGIERYYFKMIYI